MNNEDIHKDIQKDIRNDISNNIRNNISNEKRNDIRNDIRWKQRFQNYTKSLNYLENALQIPKPDITQKAGIIHFFEMTFDLAWKLIKDYLEEQGFVDIKSPRSALKKAYEINILEKGHDWMDLLQDRNLTAHTYDEQKATEMEHLIQHKYFPLLKELFNGFKQKLDEK